MLMFIYYLLIMEVTYWITLLASVLSPVLAGVAHQCAQVMLIDCLTSYKPEGDESVCASDMNVYENLCFFAQEKCRQHSLVVLYPGKCHLTTPSSNTPDPSKNLTTTTTTTTTTSAPVSSGNGDLIYSVFCENVAKFNCTDELDPVCGTDNTFYRNECELAKSKCTNHNLTSQDLSICKTLKTLRRRLGFTKDSD